MPWRPGGGTVESPDASKTQDDVETPIEPRRLNPFEQSYEQAPPQPPDPISYRRRFWMEGDNPVVSASPVMQYEEMQHEPTHRPAPAVVANAEKEAPLAPGYQRTPADVSRAAWTGALAGWWFGRRGKGKAVEQARQSGIAEGMAKAKKATGRLEAPLNTNRHSSDGPAPRLEAEPLYVHQVPEGGRKTVEPLAVVTRDRVRAPEYSTGTLAGAAEVMASIAVFERVVNRDHRSQAEIPPTIRVAAAKAAEAVVVRPIEAGSKPAAVERQLGKRELLKVAKDIKIDGISLKEIYNANRLDDEGLRATVNAYLRGGDVRQRLAQEVALKEQSFEWDPVLRKQHMQGERRKVSELEQRRADQATGHGGGVGRTVSTALSTAAASTESAARSAGRAISSGAKTAQRDLIDNANTTDWLSITAVVVLYSIILILLLT